MTAEYSSARNTMILNPLEDDPPIHTYIQQQQQLHCNKLKIMITSSKVGNILYARPTAYHDV
jgi:hypothetical protein